MPAATASAALIVASDGPSGVTSLNAIFVATRSVPSAALAVPSIFVDGVRELRNLVPCAAWADGAAAGGATPPVLVIPTLVLLIELPPPKLALLIELPRLRVLLAPSSA